ncbi:MAG: hypothetical protein HY613_05170 [Candidatus Rokubacteria bacterium]|nr:hypothetical protein [Candidatus Rokubacteria bacterium]
MSVVLAVILLTLLGVPGDSPAQPKAVTEVVYGLSAFDGEGYSPVFAPQAARTIYLLEGVPNAVIPRRTQVYFWPLTEQYLPDWTALNEELDGRLRIRRGEEIVQELERRPYALVYPRGPYGPRELAINDEASARYAAFQRQQREYENALERYSREHTRHVERLRRRPAPQEPPPREPAKPLGVVSPPAKAFVVSLPAGTYTLALLTGEGKEVEGSRRDLVVFRARRRGIGYKIIPPARWNEPLQSPTAQDAIYAVGHTSVYVQPYAAQEFNEALYARLRNPQDRKASEARWVWVLGAADFSKPLQVKGEGASSVRVKPSLYLVVQTEGTKLGYRILKQSRDALQPLEHGFTAYEVAISQAGRLTISLVCNQDEICPQSQRDVVVVGQTPFMLYAAASFPLLLGAALIGYRRISTRSSPAAESDRAETG